MRGFHGSHVRDYMTATSPAFAVGEYWDSLAYSNGIPDHNQVAALGGLTWQHAFLKSGTLMLKKPAPRTKSANAGGPYDLYSGKAEEPCCLTGARRHA